MRFVKRLSAALVILIAVLACAPRFDAITYLASAALLSTVQVPSPKARKASPSPGVLLKELTHGARVLLREPAIRQTPHHKYGGSGGRCLCNCSHDCLRSDVLGRADAIVGLRTRL